MRANPITRLINDFKMYVIKKGNLFAVNLMIQSP